MTSFREMVKENPEEYAVLVRLLKLPPSNLLKVVTTGITKLGLHVDEENLDRLFDSIKRQSLEKLAGAKAKDVDAARKEKCVVCEEVFLSDNSDEVPICLPCLTGYKKEASV